MSEVSRLIFFFFFNKISLPLSTTGKSKAHCRLRLATALIAYEVVLFVEEAAVQEEIWVRLCALGVHDKACEAYGTSVSSQSSGSTSLSAELQLSPRVLRDSALAR